MDEPYHYLRREQIGGTEFIIVGGEDHKTGQDTHPEARFDRLTAYAQERFGIVKPSHTWSAEVVESVDGLPYVGKSPGRQMSSSRPACGSGTTFASSRDPALSHGARRGSPHGGLFNPSRKSLWADAQKAFK
jgi:glycine/D-amino acid oxidase-like deaminating enzyme